MTSMIPNHTQIPNIFIDEIIQHLSGAELQVMLVAYRKTIGWHKTTDTISISQFADLTGMTRKTVMRAIEALQGLGLLIVDKSSGRTSTYTPAREYTDEMRVKVETRQTSGKNDTGVKMTPVPVVKSTPVNAPTGVKITPTKEKDLNKEKVAPAKPINWDYELGKLFTEAIGYRWHQGLVGQAIDAIKALKKPVEADGGALDEAMVRDFVSYCKRQNLQGEYRPKRISGWMGANRVDDWYREWRERKSPQQPTTNYVIDRMSEDVPF